MTFTTLTFLIFLVVFFALYWGLRQRRAQNALIVVASYFFYGWWDWRFCFLMLAASLLDFAVGLGLNRVEAPRKRKALLTLGLGGNLLMLGFFKYFNFFAESLRALASSVGWQMDTVTLKVVLPVGISFYTFQTMSYTIDVFRGKLRATPHLLEYLAYVSFGLSGKGSSCFLFPPSVRHSLLREISRARPLPGATVAREIKRSNAGHRRRNEIPVGGLL